jgi:putative spermidine/putrescine transport system permease protein
VILPSIWPSVLAGSVLLFAVAMGAFATAFALVGSGVNILPLLIYTQVSDVSYNLPQANALAMILTMVTTFLIYLYQRVFLPAK